MRDEHDRSSVVNRPRDRIRDATLGQASRCLVTEEAQVARDTTNVVCLIAAHARFEQVAGEDCEDA